MNRPNTASVRMLKTFATIENNEAWLQDGFGCISHRIPRISTTNCIPNTIGIQMKRENMPKGPRISKENPYINTNDDTARVSLGSKMDVPTNMMGTPRAADIKVRINEFFVAIENRKMLNRLAIIQAFKKIVAAQARATHPKLTK